MKKLHILSLLTICCYLLLSLSYSYGATPPIASRTSHALIDSSPTASVASPTPLLIRLCELIKQGEKYHDQNDDHSAIANYKKALQKYSQNYTEESILSTIIYDKLGVSCLALKAYPESHHFLQQALKIRQTFLSIATSCHNETIRKPISEVTGESHHHLGCLYLATDKPKAAIISFKAALETEWQHHEKAIETRCYLAKAYQLEKGYQKHKGVYETIPAHQANIPHLAPKEAKALYQIPAKIPKNGHMHPSMTTSNRQAAPQLNSALHDTPEAQQPSLNSNIGVKKVSKKATLLPHKSTHTQAKPSSCDRCEKRFRSQIDLTRHLRTHTGEKPFTCPTCHKRFSQHHHMKDHQRIHTGEKPFDCPTCHKKFSHKNSMQRHQRIHTGEKTFTCPTCHKKFSRKDNMRKHQRVHTREKPFECPVCRRKFSQKQNMTTHMHMHKGEKPFKCPTCHKRFSQKHSMKEHQRIHTGEKPFTCPTCHKGFSQKHSMQRHQRMHKK